MADVDAVISALHLKPVRRTGDEQILICPFCSFDKERPKLYLNIKKGTFICQHCHTSGSITDLWAMLTKTDTKTAYKQMLKASILTPDIEIPEPPPVKTVPAEKISQVYEEFFNMLKLNEVHKEDLLRRGLPCSYLKFFKSLPEDGPVRWEICRILNKKYNLEGIPGFRQQTSRKGKYYWDCIHSGMLIPVRDIKGRITSFQVRTGGDPKYIFFSYAGQLKSSAHVIPGRGIPWIIEGILKSYVAHSFLHVPCIGIPGTNTYKTIPLQYIKGGRVVLVYDIEENTYTMEAKKKAVEYLKDNGFEVILASWNPALGKGIDDVCLNLSRKGEKLYPELFIPGIAA